MRKTYTHAVQKLRSMNESTYDKLIIEKVMDYSFWEKFQQQTRPDHTVTAAAPLRNMADALQCFNAFSKRLFHRKMMKTLLYYDGLQDITPLQFLFLHFAASRQRLWSKVAHDADVKPLPDILLAVHDGTLSAVYARDIILSLLCEALTSRQIVVFDERTVDSMISSQDAPTEWLYATMQWETLSNRTPDKVFGRMQEFTPYVMEAQ